MSDAASKTYRDGAERGVIKRKKRRKEEKRRRALVDCNVIVKCNSKFKKAILISQSVKINCDVAGEQNVKKLSGAKCNKRK